MSDRIPDHASFIDRTVTSPPLGSSSLGEWWHQILRHYNFYPSYAIMLALPSDAEAIRYLKDFGKELHLITSNVCLVITLTGLGFMQYGSNETMPLAVNESIAEGYCLQVAELFDIKFNRFPCLVLFRDIRTPEHILVTLKGLSAEEIAQEMREVFSVIKQAASEAQDPITILKKYNKQQANSEKRKAIWSSIQSFGKTLEKVMETLIEVNLKKGAA